MLIANLVRYQPQIYRPDSLDCTSPTASKSIGHHPRREILQSQRGKEEAHEHPRIAVELLVIAQKL